MEEEGKVISVDKDISYVRIEMGKVCYECKVCDKSEPIILEVENSIGAKIGQKVKLETKIITKTRGIIFYLILPPLLLVFGIIAGSLITNYFDLSYKIGEIIGVLTGLLLCALSFLFTYWLDKRDKKNKKLSSKIVKIMGND